MLYDQPNWKDYGPATRQTRNVIEYWNNPLLAGGPIIKDVATSKVGIIKTPLYKTIKKTLGDGHFVFNKIKYSEELENTFIDLWLYSTNADDYDRLNDLEGDWSASTPYCCWVFPSDIV